jgi:Ca2+-binding RTX toxin-like protein
MPIGRIGTDLIVNTLTVNDQGRPSVTSLADGRFIVTWQSDEGDLEIRVRLYNPDGTPAGNDFQANSTTANDQGNPSVAPLADGRYFVTWDSNEFGGGTDSNIRGRIFDANGVPVANDFFVNTTVVMDQTFPTMTSLADGRVLVAWRSDDLLGDGDIRARLFSLDGTPADNDFIVNTTTADNQFSPSVTSFADGRYLVTWTSDDAGLNIRARLYNLNGTPVGDDFVVNTSSLPIGSPSATSLADGRYVVTWQSLAGLGDNDIRARIFNANGSPVGDDFVVNNTTANVQGSPSTTALADGRFVITWQSDEGGGDNDIRARLFNLDGTAAGNDFVVNTTTVNDQIVPSVTALADGRFVVTWQSDEGATGNDIRAQIFDPTVFVGTSGGDVWMGGNFADRMSGYGGQDDLSGLGGDDRLSGDSGNDTLNGGNGNDLLFGGANNDVLTGGLGRDLMSGGPGRDLFDFNSFKETGRGAKRDIIQDFQSVDNITGDDIDLTTIDAKAGVKHNQAFKFIGAQHFHDKAGELRFIDKGASCIVQGDVNGDGKADFEILVKVGTLHQSDFLL